jgi:predicted Zn-dependent protease
MDPADAAGRANLSGSLMNLNRVDEARATLEQGLAHKTDGPFIRYRLYQLYFLLGDAGQMARQVAWSKDQPYANSMFQVLENWTAAYYGRLKVARAFTQNAVEIAQRDRMTDTSAGWQGVAAWRDAELHLFADARVEATRTLQMTNTWRARVLAMIAFARAGDEARAQKIASDVSAEFPSDTTTNSYWVPAPRAASALQRNDATAALEALRPVAPYEMAEPDWNCMFTVYLRGQAYLLARQGREAAQEFQKMIDRRGAVINCPMGALARLGLARAYAMSGDTAGARNAYQDFLALWKDADPDLPFLVQAKAQSAGLN